MEDAERAEQPTTVISANALMTFATYENRLFEESENVRANLRILNVLRRVCDFELSFERYNSFATTFGHVKLSVHFLQPCQLNFDANLRMTTDSLLMSSE